MKGVIKVRSFDSLKKLNYKRAKGKSINIKSLNTSTSRAIVTLEKLGLLTPELLWELVERRKYLYIEERKLEWIMRSREKNLPLFSEDVNDYVNMLANTHIAILRVPYEIQDKYKNYVWKKDIDGNKESNIPG
jgi:hypothetical protein